MVMKATDARQSPWAPWWAYVVPIAVLNFLRQVLIPPDEVGDAVSIGLFFAVAVAVFAIVTAVQRLRP